MCLFSEKSAASSRLLGIFHFASISAMKNRFSVLRKANPSEGTFRTSLFHFRNLKTHRKKMGQGGQKPISTQFSTLKPAGPQRPSGSALGTTPLRKRPEQRPCWNCSGCAFLPKSTFCQKGVYGHMHRVVQMAQMVKMVKMVILGQNGQNGQLQASAELRERTKAGSSTQQHAAARSTTHHAPRSSTTQQHHAAAEMTKNTMVFY